MGVTIMDKRRCEGKKNEESTSKVHIEIERFENTEKDIRVILVMDK